MIVELRCPAVSCGYVVCMAGGVWHAADVVALPLWRDLSDMLLTLIQHMEDKGHLLMHPIECNPNRTQTLKELYG